MPTNNKQPLRWYRLYDWRTQKRSKRVQLTKDEALIFNRAYATNQYSLVYILES